MTSGLNSLLYETQLLRNERVSFLDDEMNPADVAGTSSGVALESPLLRNFAPSESHHSYRFDNGARFTSSMIQNSQKYMSLFSPIQARAFESVYTSFINGNISGRSFGRALEYSLSVQQEIARDYVASSALHDPFRLAAQCVASEGDALHFNGTNSDGQLGVSQYIVLHGESSSTSNDADLSNDISEDGGQKFEIRFPLFSSSSSRE
jgi:hypothetical protein